MKLFITIVLFGGLQLAAQDMQSCPMHKENKKAASQHQADVEKHGDEAMGFVQKSGGSAVKGQSAETKTEKELPLTNQS